LLCWKYREKKGFNKEIGRHKEIKDILAKHIIKMLKDDV
jgi:hypothetical protein